MSVVFVTETAPLVSIVTELLAVPPSLMSKQLVGQNNSPSCRYVTFSPEFRCGVCYIPDGTEHEADIDCMGVCRGNAFLDECGDCVGGSSGKEPGWTKDCKGVCRGIVLPSPTDSFSNPRLKLFFKARLRFSVASVEQTTLGRMSQIVAVNASARSLPTFVVTALEV